MKNSENYRNDWNTQMNGQYIAWSGVQLILLQEIRDELKKLNGLLGCSRFVGIPTTLTDIGIAVRRTANNTTRRRRVSLKKGRRP